MIGRAARLVASRSPERNAQNMAYKPFDMPAAHIFKVEPEGTVHEIEAVGFTAPYHAPSGREGTPYTASWTHRSR